MGDLLTQAKTARETLARALGALQSDPTVPPGLMAVAEPVAQAMGALHAIERSAPDVNLSTAPAARDHIRSALGLLQTQGGAHPAVATATEAVATSLGVVFGLVRAGEAAGPGGTAIVQPLGVPQGQAVPQPQVAAQQAPQGYQQHAAPQAYQPQQAPQTYQPQQAPQAYQPQQAPQAYQPPQGAAPQAYVPQQPQVSPPAPQQQAQPAAVQPAAYAQQAPPPAAAQQPAPARPAEPAHQPPAQQPAPAPPAAQAPAPTPVGTTRFDAPLGTNSNSNFYKGLSGNDVVEHGGLFVATYAKVPAIGAPVSLHVVLPGGYEFEAMATISWTRDSGTSDAPPGFGARFTQVTSEARQLIYRYVRNREPLFHDDL